jgi:hypothetical protein
MKNLLKLEELAQLLLCIWFMGEAHAPWWCYILLVVGPDIGMLGYLVNTRVGAITYNLFHHKGLAVAIAATAYLISYELVAFGPGEVSYGGWLIAAIILFGHASMDRMLGYGLKFGDHFKHTHLGWIGGKIEE